MSRVPLPHVELAYRAPRLTSRVFLRRPLQMHCTCISPSLSGTFYPYILSVKASRLDARRLLATTTRFLVIYGLSYSIVAPGRLKFQREVPFCHFEKFPSRSLVTGVSRGRSKKIAHVQIIFLKNFSDSLRFIFKISRRAGLCGSETTPKCRKLVLVQYFLVLFMWVQPNLTFLPLFKTTK